MDLNNNLQKSPKIVPFYLRLPIYIGIVLLMSNINAVVDIFQHPDIPYFDEEHLIVGFIAGTCSAILVVILETYFRNLNKALGKITMLESFLSICANCKKIRIPDSDPQMKESWKPIESYITGKTRTMFSHGLCPDCYAKYYSELIDIEKN